MRARPDADIVLIAPIHQIVPSFSARRSVVRNFVSRHTGAAQNLLGSFKKACGAVGVRDRKITAPEFRMKHRTRFNCQLIKRNVIACHGERVAQLATPCRNGLIRPGVNQIKGIAREYALRQGDRRTGVRNPMVTAQKLQRRIIQRLHT